MRAAHTPPRQNVLVEPRQPIGQLRLVGQTVMVVGAAILAAGPAHAQERVDVATVTLEQIVAAPFPYALTAAPAGGAVAWVFNDRGAQNVWVAEPPEYRDRSVTAYTADDGVQISDFEWTADGTAIVYVRGRGRSWGEVPNPLSDPAGGVEQAVWLVRLAGGEPRFLGTGAAPAVSPRGDRVAFVHQGQIWSAPLNGSEPATQLVRPRGSAGSLRWAPNGSRLAFVSHRAEHRFVGVYDGAFNTVTYLDPSVDGDANPVWSPDGSRVAFVRLPGFHHRPLGLAVTRPPWSIHIADATTGKGQQIWIDEPGARWGDILLWAAGDRLVFTSDRGGWKRLYSISAEGGLETLLTPGTLEVEHVSLGEDGTTLFFSSNQGDLARLQLWKVNVSGGSPTPITGGAGMAWAPAPTSDGKALAYLRSEARRPPRPTIRVGQEAAQDLAPGSIPADFPASRLTIPQTVTFGAADGLEVPAVLFLPPNRDPGERQPAVVFLKGGPWSQVFAAGHHVWHQHMEYAMKQYLASRGYVVLAVNHRGSTGYGRAFGQAPGRWATGGSELHDVLGAAKYLAVRPDVDSTRIGVWGSSYGGYLAALALARASDRFAAGVAKIGVYDWSAYINRHDFPLHESPASLQLALESSPIAFVQNWRSPVLLIHGAADGNATFDQVVDLVEQLRLHRVPHELLVFPNEGHGLSVHRHWLEAHLAIEDFLDRHVKNRR